MNTKTYFTHFIFITAILLIAGFNSCSLDDSDSVSDLTAQFVVSGRVVDANADDVAVNDAMVSLGMLFEKNKGDTVVIYLDSIKTEDKGNFKLHIREFPQSQKFLLKVSDTYTGDNKRFEAKSQMVYFTNPSFENGNGSWYVGEVENKLGIIKVEFYNKDNKE